VRLLGLARNAGAEFDEIDWLACRYTTRTWEDKGFPPAVKALRDAIAEADGVIIANPEYNHSVVRDEERRRLGFAAAERVRGKARGDSRRFKRRVLVHGARATRFNVRFSLAWTRGFCRRPQFSVSFADKAFDESGV